MTAERLNKAFE